MIPRILGGILVVSACGGMGLAQATAHRRKERMLQQLIGALQVMSAELQFRLTPLPQLLRLGSEHMDGDLSKVFRCAAEEMERQAAPDASACMRAAMESLSELPSAVTDKLHLLGKSLGRFDVQGQLSGLEALAQLCQRDLDGLMRNRDARLRSYTTLGFCAGVALVILFI